MTFPDDENSLNNADQQPPEQPDAQPGSAPMESAGELGLTGDQVVPPFPPEGDVTPEFDFPRMEEDVAAFHRELDGLQFSPAVRPPEEAPVQDSARASAQPRRRRRTQRIIERPDASEIAERLESIAYRAAPTFDFFVFSFLSGCILALGYILDAPAILLIGILVAPIISPLVGAALATATGETRFFGQTFGGFLVAALVMVFAVGVLGGLASRLLQPLTSSQAFAHSRLWWPDLFLLVIGTMILVISFIQSENKPALASLMVAYELYLPVSAAGFGLGSGVQGLWPEAGLVFLIHLALSLIVSLIVFTYMGFRPLETKGYFLTGGIIFASFAIVAGFAGIGSLINIRGDKVDATPVPTSVPATSKPAPVLMAASSTPTVVQIPTPTLTRPAITATAIVTATAGFTPSPTLLPTPIYGRVQSKGDGAALRKSPGGPLIIAVQNGYLVEVLDDAPVTVAGGTWAHVIVSMPTGNKDGWMLLNLITTATPSGSP
jgi:hypothetical protein